MKIPFKYIYSALASILFLASIFVSSGCSKTEGEGFAIYLTQDNIPPTRLPILSHVDTAEHPLITINDIITYNGVTHEINLTSEAFERIANLEVPVSGRSFVVCIDKRPIYSGAFWTPISSLSFDGVTIGKPLNSQEKKEIHLELGYPSSSFYKGEDPRNDTAIMESLKQSGKLIELESQLPYSMKGYELYSWLENGRWHFTLVTGTNRNKTLEEIISGVSNFNDGWVNLHVVGLEAVKVVLSKLPPNEWVFWAYGLRGESSQHENVTLALPDQQTINSIVEYAGEFNLDIAVDSY